MLLGIAASVVGLRVTIQARPLIGRRASPSLLRGTSDNFGHADWLTMRAAKKPVPGTGPGLWRHRRRRSLPGRPGPRWPDACASSRATGGAGARAARAPLLIDPCRTGSTHALVLAGSGGFKTTSIGIPTLLTWTGSAVVLDPVPRDRTDGHRVPPAAARTQRRHARSRHSDDGRDFNVLDWIDIASPLAETHVDAVVNWISGESREASSDSSAFFKGSGRDLITCLLADMLWDPTLSPRAEDAARAAPPPGHARERRCASLLATHPRTVRLSPKARDLAGTLKDQYEETFSGIYGNANRDARWLSTPAYADLVSGGAEGPFRSAHR